MAEKTRDEKVLERRLRELEVKYRGELFSSDAKEKIGAELEIVESELEDSEKEEGKEKKESMKQIKLDMKKLESDIEKAGEEKAAGKEKGKKKKGVEKKIKKEVVKVVKVQKPKIKKSEIKKSEIKELKVKEPKVEKSAEAVGKPSQAEIKKCTENILKIKKEMGKVVMGQEKIVNGLIMGLLCNAHVLVEGVPGIAKTLAIRALASASGCSVKRIQFTVDMLPTDIIGITTYTPEKGFEIIKGPIFANFLIADEINRAPPKTQSALIEGMQEKQVTIGREKFHLPAPFFVMATENPIENAGVYPLPEAQIDRFLFKLIMGYPESEVEKKVMSTNITLKKFEEFGLKAVTTPEEIVKMQEIVKKVYLDENIKNYILSIVRKTREKDFENSEYILYGSSPRASIGLFIASKANALMNKRDYVLPEDVKKVVFDVMRHRLILSYKATIQKVSPDSIIKEILNSVRVE